MNYRSTRLNAPIVTSAQAILNGLAPDGGLYLPQQIPHFDLIYLQTLSYPQRATHILHAYFDDLDPVALKKGVETAAKRFDSPAIVPVTPCGSLWLLELDHGPTAAFKDVALTLLPHLLRIAKAAVHEDSVTHILTATSGDTGSAALAGFAGEEGFLIDVFYPSEGISTIQRRQMTTVSAPNVSVSAIQGNFDDAQNAVKKVFEQAHRFKTPLSSANSINIGRLIPQVVYYVSAYLDLVNAKVISMGQAVDVAVPTGNFGNILAATLAKLGGVPIEKLICASNANHVLTDFIATGRYDRNRPFHVTSSPSMDILVSSNLERLLSLLGGGERVNTWMKELNEKGSYAIDSDLLHTIQVTFIGEWVTEDEVLTTIAKTYHTDHRLIDPHTAVALAAAHRHPSQRPMIVASTASPFKFPATVLHALKETVDSDDAINLHRLETISAISCPKALKASLQSPVIHTHELDPTDIVEYLLRKEP
jgi:threonine synthase